MFWATGLPGRAQYGPGGFAGMPYDGQYSREQERDFLKDQSASLKDQLSAIDSRLRELQSESES
jgi:hypothetical protein